MTTGSREATTGDRLYFLDNLRAAMIFLVVLYHAGAVYESSGIFASFWIVDDASTNDAVGLLNVFIDIFVMSTIFFVSGFLAARSAAHTKGWAFLTQRLRRLMIPWLLAVVTLIPLYKVIFLYSRHLPQEHWSTYFHFTNGIYSQNWLWFLPVLFCFDVLYWLLARARVRLPDITLRTGTGVVFAIGVLYSVAMSLLGGTGWTKTILLDFQNERLLIYFLVFLLGSLCFRLKVLESQPGSKWLYIAVGSTVWIPMNVYLVLLLNFVFRPGQYYVSVMVDVLVMWVAFHLSMLGLLYVLVTTFRRYGNGHGTLSRLLSANSYGVYIVHVVVLGAIALTMLDAGLPSLWKYVLLAGSTYAASNAIVYGYREVLKPRLVA